MPNHARKPAILYLLPSTAQTSVWKAASVTLASSSVVLSVSLHPSVGAPASRGATSSYRSSGLIQTARRSALVKATTIFSASPGNVRLRKPVAIRMAS